LIEKLDEDERKLLAPGADITIDIRTDVGYTKKLNDKIESLMQDIKNRQILELRMRDIQMLSKRRSRKVPSVDSKNSQDASPSLKMRLTQGMSPSKSPVRYLGQKDSMKSLNQSPDRFLKQPNTV
jgi:hypothetical protein